jgi:ammonia channel protein AmtB
VPAIFVLSWMIYFLTDKIASIRVTEKQEEIGLDLSQHNEMIKGFQ